MIPARHPLARDLIRPAVALDAYSTVEQAARVLGGQTCFLRRDEHWLDVRATDLVGAPHTRRIIESPLRRVLPLASIDPVEDLSFADDESRPVLDETGHLIGGVNRGALLSYRAAVDELIELRWSVRTVAHDLGNVLTCATVALDEGDTAACESAFTQIATLTRRLGQSLQPEAVPEPLALARFLSHAAHDLSTLTGLRVHASPTTERVAAPPGRLQRVLLNLCLNAAAAGATWVRFAATREDAGVLLAVRDDGPGFAPAVAARAFEPGFSTSNGSGLGLPSIRGLVQQLGGTVTIAESPAGACIEIRLPSA